MVHNTALNSSMSIDITIYTIRIGRFGPGRGYISTGIAETLTFLLKCCVMTQQEGTMQDVYTFAGLPEYGPYGYSPLNMHEHSPRLFRGEYSLYIRAKLTSAVNHHDSYIGFCCVS